MAGNGDLRATGICTAIGRRMARGAAVALGLVCVLGLAAPAAHVEARPRYLIVRHAEKVTGTSDPDPALLPEGRERARLLKEMLRDLPIVGIYASQYQRTQLTVAPLATERKIPVSIYDARNPDSLVAALPRRHPDGDVVIATHLGSLQKLLRGFGVPGEWDIADHEYDNLFIVAPADSTRPLEWIRLHFGER